MATKKKTAKKKSRPVITKKKPVIKKPPAPDKPPNTRKPGRGGNVLPDTTKPFTKTNQPTSEQKKEGWRKRRILKEIINISTKTIIGTTNTDYRQLAAEYFGINPEEVSIDLIMDFRQIEKAILKADTAAYVAVKDRAHGRPKQEVELLPPTTIFINGKKVAET